MAYFNYYSKKIYYKIYGQGVPLIMLHGDSASSKMFQYLISLYDCNFKVILLDFLGNGKSQRIEHFPENHWIYQADQVIKLIEYLNLEKVNIIGCSGGAWTAINVALKRPDLTNKIIVDSFDGRTLHKGFAKELVAERNKAKADKSAREFYKWCQGEDWEKVIDANTRALVNCAQSKRPLFIKDLALLKTPILFVGSHEDQMCRKDMYEEYRQMCKIVAKGKIYMFKKGGHPTILSNAEKFSVLVKDFILDLNK